MMHESIMLLKEQLDNVLQHNKCFSLLPDVLNSAKTANEKTNTIIQTENYLCQFKRSRAKILGHLSLF